MTQSDDERLIDVAEFVFNLAREGKTLQLKAYISAGAPVNLCDSKGNSLLMLAAYHGHAETVTMLLDEGAAVDQLNDRGQSPLAGAVFKKEQEVIAVLIAKGADIDAGNPSARQTAAMFGIALEL